MCQRVQCVVPGSGGGWVAGVMGGYRDVVGWWGARGTAPGSGPGPRFGSVPHCNGVPHGCIPTVTLQGRVYSHCNGAEQ